MEYASNAKANAGLTTGIIGTVGTAMGVLGNNGLNLFGNRNPDNDAITKYDAHLMGEIAKKDEKIALLESQIYTDNKIDAKLEKMNDRYEMRFAGIEARQNQQDVYNATNNGAIGTLNTQIAYLNGIVGNITKTVVPNTSICPGWGNVTITPSTATTTAGN